LGEQITSLTGYCSSEPSVRERTRIRWDVESTRKENVAAWVGSQGTTSP